MTHSTSFDFSLPLHKWDGFFDDLLKSGIANLSAPIHWGVYEPAPRMRDFTKGPARNLEKLLQVCCEKKVKLDLMLGFPATVEAFPRWIFGLKKRGLVPAPLMRSETFNFSFVETPSFSEAGFEEGYLDFLSELFSVIAPYSEQLSKLYFDFGVFAWDVALCGKPNFLDALRERYDSISSLNRLYGTSFKDFETLKSSKAMSLLMERRPWLALFDLKWVRSQSLLNFWVKAKALGLEAGLGHLMVSSLEDKKIEKSPTDWALACDPIYLDESSHQYFPFLPEEILTNSTIEVFRVWDFLSDRAVNSGVPTFCLPIHFSALEFKDRGLVVVSENYLTRVSYDFLIEQLASGVQIFFPFGIPSFDESMEGLDWSGKFDPSNENPHLRKIRIGKGAIWEPKEKRKVSSGFWEEVNQSMQSVLAERDR